jgi:hypothetical protein
MLKPSPNRAGHFGFSLLAKPTAPRMGLITLAIQPKAMPAIAEGDTMYAVENMPINTAPPSATKDATPNTALRTTAVLLMYAKANDQLTDGGPSVAPESPSAAAGPPFGEVAGSVICAATRLSRSSRDPSST